ncbi:hypothetical protein GT348_07300 [Aristophania vespae]|uniref:Uncharacterized protein n=1 Tax=Aristophania vespae TaxID=2697033 RepID=A0A6P1NF31_9PROT|nr:baseplate J/gp47 family protein [Aristophania vespae]QHI96068.1 hypothetical protein GT348_07300 [Aristophania vespae]UMM63834.1 hypothetical protein DM15PD_08110 [Aristophania vespae]
MSVVIPTPTQLAERYVTAFSQTDFIASDGSTVKLDPTAPGTFEQVLAAAKSMADYETYLYIRDRFLQVLPTTATTGPGGLLPQHGQIWGVPRRSAQSALGHVIITAQSDASLPGGTILTNNGTVQWALNEAVSLTAGESVSAAVTCVQRGTAGNLAPHSSLSLIEPVAGIRTVTVDQNGLTGGDDIEPTETWRQRILNAIRKPYQGGSKDDYIQWAKQFGASYVNVVPSYTGPGTVGIIVAMSGPRTPSDDEVKRLQDNIDSVRPIRGNATIYGAVIKNEEVTVTIKPDTGPIREKVHSALSTVYASVGIGGTLYRAMLENALFIAAGPYAALQSPPGDISYPSDTIPTLTHIEWGAS